MYRVKVGISYDHPKQGLIQHHPGPESVDLSDWPDLDKLLVEGTIELAAEEEPAKASGVTIAPDPAPLDAASIDGPRNTFRPSRSNRLTEKGDGI